RVDHLAAAITTGPKRDITCELRWYGAGSTEIARPSRYLKTLGLSNISGAGVSPACQREPARIFRAHPKPRDPVASCKALRVMDTGEAGPTGGGRAEALRSIL